MRTKLLIEICGLEQGQYFIENKLGSLLLNIKDYTYTKQFNCYTNELSILAQKAQENGVELLAHLDMLYHEDDLIGLRAILKKLHSLNIKKLIICDVAVIEIAKELKLDFVFINGSSTLNTNYASIEYTNNFYRGYFLSNEINIEEIKKIAQQNNSELIVQIFGKQKMFSSKRKLLTSYLEFNEIRDVIVTPKSYLIIKDTANEDNQSYIYEDQFGTYIYTKNNVNALEYLDTLIENKIEYLYLNNLFTTQEEYREVVNIFYKCLNDKYDLSSVQVELEKVSKNLSKSFFEDETVFTIEQARLLEMEQSYE